MRTFLSDKNTVFSQISIEKITELYLMTLSCLKSLSGFFEDAVTPLSVKPDEFYLSGTENLSGPVQIAIRKFENHPSVQAIKQNIPVSQDFYFSNTEVRDILKVGLSPSKKKKFYLIY